MQTYSAKILADSIGPNGARLTTWELTYWAAIHPQVLVHRAFSRNTASNRAIPVSKLIRQVISNPAGPLSWAKNRKGMASTEEVSSVRRWIAKTVFYQLRWPVVLAAWILSKLGVHKAVANRVLAPWLWTTCIVSATSFENWFKLRCDDAAQPEIQEIANQMLVAYLANEPRHLREGEWHVPMVADGEGQTETQRKVMSVARCARVSYLTHGGKKDYKEDKRLHDDLAAHGHFSPFEHVARALTPNDNRRCGNFAGWYQYRADLPGGMS